MKITVCAITLFLIQLQVSHQRSTPDSDSYVAAVVEFPPQDPQSFNEPPTRINAWEYVSHIKRAAKQDVDIIVFPEDGLTSVNLPERTRLNEWTTLIPAPSSNYIPCIHSTIPVDEALKMISCSARDNMLYVVINIAEKVICQTDNCPSDKKLYYNTNVVFDRQGKIIARYRKTHLFLEGSFNITTIPELITFETDFGVTFGTFTCFDILFKKPAVFLTRILNVTDVVFPTAWFSEVPFLTALQIQAGWSYAEDVNFLVSGYNRPKFGNTGSGIYLGRQGIAKAIIPSMATDEMVVARVLKKNLTSSTRRPYYTYNLDEADQPMVTNEHQVHDELRRRRNIEEDISTFNEDVREKRSLDKNQNGNEKVKVEEEEGIALFHDNLSKYKSLPFNSSITQTFCDGDFCCDFDIELTNVDSTSKYYIFVFDGIREFYEPVIVGIRVCAVIQCSNDSTTSCGALEKSETTFSSISINATFPNYEDVLVIPTSIGSDLYPLANWTYEELYEDQKVHVMATLGSPAKDVVTCGIYARDFSRDGPRIKVESKIGMQWATLTALAIVSLFLLFLYRKGYRKPWHRNNQQSSEATPYQHLQTL